MQGPQAPTCNLSASPPCQPLDLAKFLVAIFSSFFRAGDGSVPALLHRRGGKGSARTRSATRADFALKFYT